MRRTKFPPTAIPPSIRPTPAIYERELAIACRQLNPGHDVRTDLAITTAFRDALALYMNPLTKRTRLFWNLPFESLPLIQRVAWKGVDAAMVAFMKRTWSKLQFRPRTDGREKEKGRQQ